MANPVSAASHPYIQTISNLRNLNRVNPTPPKRDVSRSIIEDVIGFDDADPDPLDLVVDPIKAEQAPVPHVPTLNFESPLDTIEVSDPHLDELPLAHATPLPR